MRRYPYHRQQTDWNCGPACAQMVLGADGRRVSQETCARVLRSSRYHGTNRLDLVRGFRRLGYRVRAHHGATLAEVRALLRDGWHVVVNYTEPSEDIGHYAIVRDLTLLSIILCDPWNGPRFRLRRAEFIRRWHGMSDGPYTHWIIAVRPRTHRPKK